MQAQQNLQVQRFCGRLKRAMCRTGTRQNMRNKCRAEPFGHSPGQTTGLGNWIPNERASEESPTARNGKLALVSLGLEARDAGLQLPRHLDNFSGARTIALRGI